MLPQDFVDEIHSKYQNLHNEDADAFEMTVELNNGLTVTVEGERDDASSWGELKYALDGRVRIGVPEEPDWENVEEELEEVTDQLEEVLEDTIGYNGPVVVRSNNDPTLKEWSRRMLHEEGEE